MATFGGLFQGPPWVAERAHAGAPFASVYDLRKAFQDALFAADPDEQQALITAYPDLAGAAARGQRLGARSVLDQAFAGLDQLSAEEHVTFDELNRA